MNWTEVYKTWDYLNLVTRGGVTGIFITPALTVVIVFNQPDTPSLTEYCYNFSDGSIAYGR